MRSKSRQDKLGRYVLIGAIALLIVAAGVLAVAVVKRQLNVKDDAPSAQVKKGPVVAAASPRPAAPVQPSPTAAPAPAPSRLPPAVEEKPISITSDELRQQHAANEAAATQRFKDKQLQVTGIVSVIYHEAPLVGIGFGTLQDSAPPILCEMNSQQLGSLSQVRPGQMVTLIGTYSGKVQGGFIGLGNCRIVAQGSPGQR